MESLKKMTCEHRVFVRKEVLRENIGMKALCFLENGRFLSKMGMSAIIVHQKLEKRAFY